MQDWLKYNKKLDKVKTISEELQEVHGYSKKRADKLAESLATKQVLKPKKKKCDCDGKGCGCKVQEARAYYGYGFKDDILEFLNRNPEPDDFEVDDFALSLGCKPEHLKREMYKLLSDCLMGHVPNKPIAGTNIMQQVPLRLQTESIIDFNPLADLVRGQYGFAVKVLGEAETQEDAHAGFDLTDISAKNWKKLVKMIGAKEKPKKGSGTKTKYGFSELGWIWQGKDVVLVSANDPITGERYNGGREAEKDYASYIGISGNPAMVKKVYDFIKKNADNVKGYNKTEREFI